jgi:hypothetical protein
VRFPHRAERLFDDPNDIMADDKDGLSLSEDVIDVLIVEVKTNTCTLNGPGRTRTDKMFTGYWRRSLCPHEWAR